MACLILFLLFFLVQSMVFAFWVKESQRKAWAVFIPCLRMKLIGTLYGFSEIKTYLLLIADGLVFITGLYFSLPLMVELPYFLKLIVLVFAASTFFLNFLLLPDTANFFKKNNLSLSLWLGVLVFPFIFFPYQYLTRKKLK